MTKNKMPLKPQHRGNQTQCFSKSGKL